MTYDRHPGRWLRALLFQFIEDFTGIDEVEIAGKGDQMDRVR